MAPACIAFRTLLASRFLGPAHPWQIPFELAFPLSGFAGWFALRSGVLYLRGSAVHRATEPILFWVVFLLALGPPLFTSGAVIVLYLGSLFRSA